MNKQNLLPIFIIVVGIGISAVLVFGNRAPSAPVDTTIKVIANQPVAENLRKVDLEINGMFCLGCRGSVISSVTALSGVLQADADPSTDSGWVVYDPALISKEEIAATPIFEVYPANILDDQPYSQPVVNNKTAEIPAEILDKLNLLAIKLKEGGVVMESFFRDELDQAIQQGYFDKANNLLDNYLKAYE